ncbi:MAG TPA: acetylglutamate kinase [Candidatus Sumerlaeota bacterium]|nr:acetylglutamate kinase [Candidatus Sumerlaeota bacterium]
MNDIAILKEALPYLRKFKGSLFVIKFGGEAMRTREALELLAEDIAFIHGVGISVVLVHGGGAQVTEMEKKLGVESRFVAGRRVTDEGSLGVLKMVLGGTLNLDLVGVMKQFGAKAVGLSGASGGLLEATKRPPKKVTGSDEVVDFGHVGDITSVDVTVIHSLLKDGFLPIISPLAADAQGNVLNVNADVAAARIASALKASKLLLMSDIPGVMEDTKDRTTLIGQLDTAQAQAAIKQGIISGGMIPKVEESLAALKNGVKQVHILSATEPHTLLLEVFTESGCGTMIVE